MIRVNLLPWRAERRLAQRKHLGILAGMVSALAAGIVVLGHVIIAGYISDQEARNKYVKDENARLDKEIDEIKKLREEITALLARKQVIERLQADRSQVVNLLDQLVRQTPDGVYLKSLKQQGTRVNVTGYAQSNARVSTLMRNVSGSPHLESPELIEIKAALVNNKRVSEFNMNFALKRSEIEEDTKGAKGAKGAGKGDAKKG
jgi:type IV pilus assembly protein PilN